MNEPNRIRIASVAELDALVGVHVTDETPELMWEDSHGHFQFETEAEALIAIADPYYQQFLPDVDWTKTVVRQVKIFRLYCSDPTAIWIVVDKASSAHGPLLMWREQGRWHAAFGSNADAEARTPNVAICLAALTACKLKFDVNHAALIHRSINSPPCRRLACLRRIDATSPQRAACQFRQCRTGSTSPARRVSGAIPQSAQSPLP